MTLSLSFCHSFFIELIVPIVNKYPAVRLFIGIIGNRATINGKIFFWARTAMLIMRVNPNIITYQCNLCIILSMTK
jgi:hypothetical protein